MDIIGSNCSIRGNLCGKVVFALQTQSVFFHMEIVEKNNFCTALVERKAFPLFEQVIFPLSTTPCGKITDRN